MLRIKPIIFSMLFCFYLVSGLLLPALSQADEVNSWGGSSGTFDSAKAAEQRAAEAKKKAKRQKAAEEKKAAETKKTEEEAQRQGAANNN